MKHYNCFLWILIILLTSCNDDSRDEKPLTFSISDLSTPCDHGGEPNLFVTEEGQVYLSWIEYLDDTTDVLMFSTLEKGAWSEPVPIASGSDWFVNWADFPSLAAYRGEETVLAAHWLQKSAKGTYDYDIHISQSLDGGVNWDPSFIPHRDGVPAEYGFVSMLPISSDRMFATWLDGRNTKTNEGNSHSGHEHSGSMTLRAAEFDKTGNLFHEVELDGKVCDCCQTSAAMTDEGIIVVYRDRSDDEVRDISIVRRIEDRWTDPKTVHNDGWKITACPVNGPSIKAMGRHVVLAWFTMAGEKPMVKVAFSQNSGRIFSPPVRVDDGNPIGRVDVVMLSGNEALVSWLEKTTDAAEIRAVMVRPNERSDQSFTISRSHTSRRSGFPRMVKSGDDIICTWTEADSLTRIKTVQLRIPQL